MKKITISTQFEEEEVKALKRLAEKNSRSLAGQIRHFVKDGLEGEKDHG